MVLPRRPAPPLLPLRLALLFNPGGLQDLAHRVDQPLRIGSEPFVADAERVAAAPTVPTPVAAGWPEASAPPPPARGSPERRASGPCPPLRARNLPGCLTGAGPPRRPRWPWRLLRSAGVAANFEEKEIPSKLVQVAAGKTAPSNGQLRTFASPGHAFEPHRWLSQEIVSEPSIETHCSAKCGSRRPATVAKHSARIPVRKP